MGTAKDSYDESRAREQYSESCSPLFTIPPYLSPNTLARNQNSPDLLLRMKETLDQPASTGGGRDGLSKGRSADAIDVLNITVRYAKYMLL